MLTRGALHLPVTLRGSLCLLLHSCWGRGGGGGGGGALWGTSVGHRNKLRDARVSCLTRCVARRSYTGTTGDGGSHGYTYPGGGAVGGTGAGCCIPPPHTSPPPQPHSPAPHLRTHTISCRFRSVRRGSRRAGQQGKALRGGWGCHGRVHGASEGRGDHSQREPPDCLHHPSHTTQPNLSSSSD